MHEILKYTVNPENSLADVAHKELFSYFIKYIDVARIFKEKKKFKQVFHNFIMSFQSVDRYALDTFLQLSRKHNELCSLTQLQHLLKHISPLEYFLASCFTRDIAEFYLVHDNPYHYNINYFIEKVKIDIQAQTDKKENQQEFLDFFLKQPNLISIMHFVFSVYKNNPDIFNEDIIEQLNTEIIRNFDITRHHYNPTTLMTGQRVEELLNKNLDLIPLFIEKFQCFYLHLTDKTLFQIFSIPAQELNETQLRRQQLCSEHFSQEQLANLSSKTIQCMLTWCISADRVAALEAIILDRNLTQKDPTCKYHKI